MRFCRQRQQQAQARHRPQSEPSPNSCSLCLRLCPGPVRLIFKLPRLISRVNLCALYCIFASTFTRPGQRRSRRLSLGLSPGLPAVPDSFSQRIFRHVADKRSKAASTSALRCLRLGPLYLPPFSSLSPLLHTLLATYFIWSSCLMKCQASCCPALAQAARQRTRLAAKGQLMVLCDKQLLP